MAALHKLIASFDSDFRPDSAATCSSPVARRPRQAPRGGHAPAARERAGDTRRGAGLRRLQGRLKMAHDMPEEYWKRLGG